jgi:hypothetical protein
MPIFIGNPGKKEGTEAQRDIGTKARSKNPERNS